MCLQRTWYVLCTLCVSERLSDSCWPDLILSLTKAAYMHMSRIQPCLAGTHHQQSETKPITSWLDYCSNLFPTFFFPSLLLTLFPVHQPVKITMQDDLTTLLTSLSWLPISLSIKAEVLTTASRGLYALTPDCSSYSSITWSALGTLAFLLFPEHAISRGFKTCSFVCLEYSSPDLCMACYLTPFNHLLRNHLLSNSSWISCLKFP